ncbi:MAG: AmmeMemoRadiSam system protein A [Lentisphaerota bacterium]
MKNNTPYTPEQQKFLLDLVKNTIRNKLHGVSPTKNKDKVPDFLSGTQSCFVTLHTKDGNLRGCIGNIMAFEPLYDNIVHNAFNSAFRDPRFAPVSSEEEFDTLRVEISILTPMKTVNSYKEIKIGTHGVTFKLGRYSSVFLPQVAPEQGWTLEETLTHLSMKAGLGPDAWKHIDAKFEVFEALIISEE